LLHLVGLTLIYLSKMHGHSNIKDSFRFPHGDLDYDWITGRKERAIVGPKLKYYPGIWIREGPLFVIFYFNFATVSNNSVVYIHRLVRWVISFATSCIVLKLCGNKCWKKI